MNNYFLYFVLSINCWHCYVHSMQAKWILDKQKQKVTEKTIFKDRYITLLLMAKTTVGNLDTIPFEIRQNILTQYIKESKLYSIAYQVPRYWILVQNEQRAAQYLGLVHKEKIKAQFLFTPFAVIPRKIHDDDITTIQNRFAECKPSEHISNITVRYNYPVYDGAIWWISPGNTKYIILSGIKTGSFGFIGTGLFACLLGNVSAAAIIPTGIGSLLGFIVGTVKAYSENVRNRIKQSECYIRNDVSVPQIKEN